MTLFAFHPFHPVGKRSLTLSALGAGFLTAPLRSTEGLLFTIQCRSTSHRFAVGNAKASSPRMKIASVPDLRPILCGRDFRAAKTSLTHRVGVVCILPDTLARTAKRNCGSVRGKHTSPKRERGNKSSTFRCQNSSLSICSG